MLLCPSSAGGEGAGEGMCRVRPKVRLVPCSSPVPPASPWFPGDWEGAGPPPHPPPDVCAGGQGWGWRGVRSCLHGKEWRDVCLQPLVLLCCWPPLYFFACLKVALVAPGLLSCLQISVSFLLEQPLEAGCSSVTKASWRTRCSPTSWYEQGGWGTAHRYFFGWGRGGGRGGGLRR